MTLSPRTTPVMVVLRLLLVLILPLFAVIPSLTQPIEQYGLDAAYFHIYRGVLFSAARDEGWFYPHWLPDLNAGLGGPLLTYYPPGIYFALDALYRIGIPHPLGWRVLVAGSLLAASLGAFGLARTLFKRDEVALASAAVFTYSPYFFFDLFERGGPQGMATTLFPWVLWGLLRFIEQPSGWRLALVAGPWACLILLHNSTALIFSAVLAPFIIFLAARHGLRSLWLIGLSLSAGVVLAALHVMPFLFDLPLVRPEADPMPAWAQPALNPLPLSQVLGAPAVFDIGFALNSMEEKAGLLQAASILAALPLTIWLLARRRWSEAVLAIGLMIAGAGAIWLTGASATGAWEALPVLNVIQFRGRLLLLIGSVAALAFGLWLNAWRDGWRQWGAAVLTTLSIGLALPLTYPNLLRFYGNLSSRPDVAEVRAFMAETGLFGLTSMEQFIPRWRTQPFTSSEFEQSARAPFAGLPEGARVLSSDRHAQSWRIEIETPVAFEAALLQLYFPGWQAAIDSQPVNLRPMPETGYTLLNMPTGKSILELRYVETWAQRAGLWMSGLALVILVALVFAWRGKTGGQQQALQSGNHAPLVWALAVLGIALGLKTWWVDPHTTLFRHNSTCAAIYGAQTEVDVRFGDSFRLCGITLSRRTLVPGEATQLTLYWELQQPGPTQTVFVQVLGDQPDLGQAPKIGQRDTLIFGGLPVEDWRLGKLYRDSFDFSAAEDSPPGNYLFLVGITDSATGQRLQLNAVQLPADITIFAGDSLLIHGLTVQAK